MGLEAVTGAVIHTAWNLPPTRLARFLVATVVPGAYARDVLLRHEQAQRRYDENTRQVLASVVLWQRHSESPTCLREAESVLRAYCQQSRATLDSALDPHAAAVAGLLLRGTRSGPSRRRIRPRVPPVPRSGSRPHVSWACGDRHSRRGDRWLWHALGGDSGDPRIRPDGCAGMPDLDRAIREGLDGRDRDDLDRLAGWAAAEAGLLGANPERGMRPPHCGCYFVTAKPKGAGGALPGTHPTNEQGHPDHSADTADPPRQPTLAGRQNSVLVEVYDSFHPRDEANETGGSAASNLTDTHEGHSQCPSGKTEKE